MSYWCEINFKKMEEKDIIPFLRSLKKRLVFDFSEIAKDNYVYCPFVKKHLFDLPEKYSDLVIKEESDVFNASYNWACNLFAFRYFYDTEYHLLGVFGVPNAVKDLFDASIEFQDSCDQDYEASHWHGVKEFEEIYGKWITKDVGEIKEIYNEKYNPFNFDKEYPDPIDASKHLAYWRKSSAYEEIWKRYQGELYNDEDAIYFSCFSANDLTVLYKFLSRCFTYAKMVEEKYKSEEKTK